MLVCKSMRSSTLPSVLLLSPDCVEEHGCLSGASTGAGTIVPLAKTRSTRPAASSHDEGQRVSSVATPA